MSVVIFMVIPTLQHIAKIPSGFSTIRNPQPSKDNPICAKANVYITICTTEI